MNPEIITRKSKKLSWLLRHGAGREGLPMDAAGWVPVDDVLRRLRLDRGTLAEVVRRNNKNRLEWQGERIRCCQGHSLDGMPVTQAALEASWSPWAGGVVWHGTHVDAVEPIAREGIVPGRRTHVHLAPELNSVVGKRAAVHVMLAVDPARMAEHGVDLYEAPNGVVLTRYVPPACIVELRASTRRARAREDALRALLPAA